MLVGHRQPGWEPYRFYGTVMQLGEQGNATGVFGSAWAGVDAASLLAYTVVKIYLQCLSCFQILVE